jgi:flagellar motor protein MotB
VRPRWQTRAEAPSHVDDWLMTYADVITLLLCFFAVFLSVSISKMNVQSKVETVQAAVVPLPQPPPHPATARVTEELPAPTKPEAPSAQPMAAPAVAAAFAAPVPKEPVASSAPPVAAKEMVVAAPPAPVIADHAKSPEPTEMSPIGDRITAWEMSSAAFFDSGSATLRRDGEVILSGVAAELKLEMFRDYRITVEGHTDDSPINTARFPSNWELSSARAAAVVRFFLEQGIPAGKLRAAGYADTFPKLPNRDANGSPILENQAQNRRVVIRLEKIDKAERAASPTLDAAFIPPDLQ